jgi:hypothetical protein
MDDVVQDYAAADRTLAGLGQGERKASKVQVSKVYDGRKRSEQCKRLL